MASELPEGGGRPAAGPAAPAAARGRRVRLARSRGTAREVAGGDGATVRGCPSGGRGRGGRGGRGPGPPPPPPAAGPRPTPTGRRRSAIPVIEISRAASKEEALAGLERWKAHWPAASGALEPADVLVDGMRGRSSLWYRVRVNLMHVAEGDRPPPKALY